MQHAFHSAGKHSAEEEATTTQTFINDATSIVRTAVPLLLAKAVSEQNHANTANVLLICHYSGVDVAFPSFESLVDTESSGTLSLAALLSSSIVQESSELLVLLSRHLFSLLVDLIHKRCKVLRFDHRI